jgi:type II secretory pathway pseudopilin PulG
MTLVELLVVAAILAVFFGLVLSIGQNDGTVTRAAQQFAAVLRRTQSKALSTEIGDAVIIEGERSTLAPAEEGVPAEEVIHPYRATTVFDALMRPDMTGGVDSGPVPTAAYATSADVVLELEPPHNDPAELLHGYKIRFLLGAKTAEDAKKADRPAQRSSEWFSFRVVDEGSYQVSFRLSGGRTNFNSVWPPRQSAPRRFVLALYPGRGDVAMTLPKRVAIDLRYSGHGDDPAQQWGALAGKGAIGVAFDMAGRVDTLMQQVLSSPDQQIVEPIDPAEPIYFLFAPRTDVADGVNTLATEDACWVVIQPPTGQVGVARNVPQQETSAAALRAARENARKAIGLGK